MGDVSVARGATSKFGQVDGDLRVGQEARIEPEDKVIQVTGLYHVRNSPLDTEKSESRATSTPKAK